MSNETNLPVIADESFISFAYNNMTKSVIPVPTGRFCVPIPKLNNEGGCLKLPNVKQLDLIIKSGSKLNEIKIAELEASPQLIKIDGTDMVVINDISKYQADAFLNLFNSLKGENKGEIDREMLVKFFEIATGIQYVKNPDGSESIALVPKNLGINGDVFNMSKEVFREKHHLVGKKSDEIEPKNDEPQLGYYNKKTVRTQGFYVTGGFARKAGESILKYPDGAMVQVGFDGVVSTIHPNDINVCYEGLDGTKLVDDDTGNIYLPIYREKEILEEQQNIWGCTR